MYLCRLPEPQDLRPGVTAGLGDVSSLTVGARQAMSWVARLYQAVEAPVVQEVPAPADPLPVQAGGLQVSFQQTLVSNKLRTDLLFSFSRLCHSPPGSFLDR